MKPCASKSRTVDKKPITTGEKDLIDFEVFPPLENINCMHYVYSTG
jgi:hypothetical protein